MTKINTLLFLDKNDLNSLNHTERTNILNYSSEIEIINPNANNFEISNNLFLKSFLDENKPKSRDIFILDNDKYINISSFNYIENDLALIRTFSVFCQTIGAKTLKFTSIKTKNITKSFNLDIETTGIIKKFIDPSAKINYENESNLKHFFNTTIEWEGSRKKNYLEEAQAFVNTQKNINNSIFEYILAQVMNTNKPSKITECLQTTRNETKRMELVTKLVFQIPQKVNTESDPLFQLRTSLSSCLSKLDEHNIEFEVTF